MSQSIKHSGSFCHEVNTHNVPIHNDNDDCCFWQVIVFSVYHSSVVKIFF